jgi:prefoldin subunit 5
MTDTTTTTTPTTTTTTPAAPPTSIGGTPIANANNSTTTAASIMQTYTNVVLQTPIMTLPSDVDSLSSSNVSTQLPADQKTAQAHATSYLDTLNPQMVGLLATTIGYANQWNAQYDELLTLANNLDEGNNLATFNQGLGLLISKCNEGVTQSNSTATALTTFQTNDLDADVQAFTIDYNNVNTAYNDNSIEITTLEGVVSADNKTMDTALWAMGAAGVFTVVGGVAVLVGVFGELESGGATTALVVGGFALAAGAATIGAVEFANWETANKNLIAATNQLNEDESALSATQQALTNIQNLGTACSNAAQAVQGLASSWDSLADDLQQTIDALNSVESGEGAPAWLVPLLNSANSDWGDALTLAKNLQANGTLPVQTQNQS